MKQTQDKIIEYLKKLPVEKFPNICGFFDNDTMMYRIADTIEAKMLKNSSLSVKDAATQVELSFYDF